MPNFFIKDALLRYNIGFLSARIGEWLFTVALNWVVFVQTESAMLLAAVNACRLMPNLFFSIPAGQLADRLDRRTLNIWANVLNAIFILAIGAVLYLKLPFIFCAALVFTRAIVTAAEGPFRNALLCSLYEGAKLKSVVAQNASVMNLGRIVGPIVGGFLLAWVGSPITFVGAALCTAGYSWALYSLPSLAPRQSSSNRLNNQFSFRRSLAEFPRLKQLILLAIPIMFFGFPFTAMLPMVTESMLKLGSEEFGALLATSAAGALLASWQLSLRPSASSWKGTKRFAALFGCSLTALSLVGGYFSAALVLFLVGYFGQAYRTSSRMLFQDIVPREHAGRMMGLALMDRGLIPLGVLLVGAIAERAGPQFGVATMGVGCLLSMALFGSYSVVGFRTRLAGALPSIGLALLAFLFLSGCNGPSTPNQTLTAKNTVPVEHVWGKTLVPQNPKKIVVLDIPFLDAFTALGQPVVGFAGTSEKAIPAYLQTAMKGDSPVFVGERKQPNLEVILSLEPDLIIANPDRHKMIRSQLEAIAPTVALTDDSLDDIHAMVATFASVTGREAERVKLESRLSEALSLARDVQEGRPSILVVGAFEDEFSTWTRGSFIGSLFQEVGADYLFDGAPSASESQTEVAKLTIESLAQLNPDFLFVYGQPERWNGNPLFDTIQACKEGRVMNIDRDLWSRARGPIAAHQILEMYVSFLKENQNIAMTPNDEASQ